MNLGHHRATATRTLPANEASSLPVALRTALNDVACCHGPGEPYRRLLVRWTSKDGRLLKRAAILAIRYEVQLCFTALRSASTLCDCTGVYAAALRTWTQPEPRERCDLDSV